MKALEVALVIAAIAVLAAMATVALAGGQSEEGRRR